LWMLFVQLRIAPKTPKPHEQKVEYKLFECYNFNNKERLSTQINYIILTKHLSIFYH